MFLMAVALVFAIIVSIFAIQNSTVVPVQFFTWRFEASLVVVILGSALAGAVVVGSISLVKQIGFSLREWELRSRIANLESEVKKLEEKARAQAVQSSASQASQP